MPETMVVGNYVHLVAFGFEGRRDRLQWANAQLSCSFSMSVVLSQEG